MAALEYIIWQMKPWGITLKRTCLWHSTSQLGADIFCQVMMICQVVKFLSLCACYFEIEELSCTDVWQTKMNTVKVYLVRAIHFGFKRALYTMLMGPLFSVRVSQSVSSFVQWKCQAGAHYRD